MNEGTGGRKALTHQALPNICITATAGTGSGADAWGAIDLKMSDFGIAPDEPVQLAVNARETMGGLFAADPTELSLEGRVAIYEKAYR